eukprot:bmy_00584T0
MQVHPKRRKYVNSYILKKNMMLMTNNFYVAILGYDEGVLSDDRGLAAALWRTFFNQKCEDPQQLELLVEYVRKQIQYLDSMNGEDLLLTGEYAQESHWVGYGAGRTLSPSKVSSPSREALSKSSPAHTPQVPSRKHAIDSFSQRPQKGMGQLTWDGGCHELRSTAQLS